MRSETQEKDRPWLHIFFRTNNSLSFSVKWGINFEEVSINLPCQCESVLFEREQPHRFWNAGEEMLQIEGWVGPVHNFPYFLSKVYEAQTKSGGRTA